MEKKARSGILLILLLMGMLTWAFNIQSVVATTSEPPATEWSKTYGGTDLDRACSVVQTSDGGYALAGSTGSFGAGFYWVDFWLVKTDVAGNMEWNKTYGGTDNDEAYSVVQTSDGGYALAGSTYSFGAGSYDFWLVKLAPPPPPAGMMADLIRRGAWPEHHHFVLSKDGDPSIEDRHGTPGYQTLYGIVENTGNVTIPAGKYKVVWNISRSTGPPRIVETVGSIDLAPGETTVLTYNVSAIDLAPGKYYVKAQCYYYGVEGEHTKTFSFTVVP